LASDTCGALNLALATITSDTESKALLNLISKSLFLIILARRLVEKQKPGWEFKKTLMQILRFFCKFKVLYRVVIKK